MPEMASVSNDDSYDDSNTIQPRWQPVTNKKVLGWLKRLNGNQREEVLREIESYTQATEGVRGHDIDEAGLIFAGGKDNTTS